VELARLTLFGRARVNHAHETKSRSRWPVIEFTLALVAVGTLAYVALDRGFVSVPLSGIQSERVVASPDIIDRHFAVCTGAGGTCVIDGDTVRIDGVSIRVADIDTPEVRNYGCAEELALGQAATRRMVALLNEGPFMLGAYERDEDVYGRKLRILVRNGQSLGMMLVEEGLARAWDGARRDWCA
jgi:micrococcal nuclease